LITEDMARLTNSWRLNTGMTTDTVYDIPNLSLLPGREGYEFGLEDVYRNFCFLKTRGTDE